MTSTCRTHRLIVAASLALCLPFAQASTEFYDAMVTSGQVTRGIFPRIVMRDDVGLAGSATFAANSAFAGVVALDFGSGPYCSGVLISPTTVLSARHCDVFVGDVARFGANASSPTFSASVQSVLLPGGGGAASPLLNGGDIAIITLAAPVPGAIATPYLLSDQTTSMVGASVTSIGFGLRGVGSTGTSDQDGLRRGGTNVMDRYGLAVDDLSTISATANIFSTDFDNPFGTSNTLGWLGSSTVATSFEATTASGDSGGPLLFNDGGQWVVLGVLSGGSTDESIYGDISWWTGVVPYRSAIEAAGGVFVTAVPEPGSYALLVLGLSVIATRRRWLSSGRQPLV